MTTLNRDKLRARQNTLAGKLTDACCHAFLLWDWAACGDEWGAEWAAVWALYDYFDQHAEIRDYRIRFPAGQPAPTQGNTISFSQSATNRHKSVTGVFTIEVEGQVESSVETTISGGFTVGAKAKFAAGALFAKAETEFSAEIRFDMAETTGQKIMSDVRSSIEATLQPGESATAEMTVQMYTYPPARAVVTARAGKKSGAPDFNFPGPEWWKAHSGDVLSYLPDDRRSLKWDVTIAGNVGGKSEAALI